MTYSLGVDLGTTFSAAAVADGGRPEVFTLGTVAPVIPSVVVLRADGEVLVGEAAERRALTEPTRTAREFKRRLGDPAPLILGGTPYGAEALMARLLRWIVEAVKQRQGGAPELIAVTHPANYGPYKLDLLDEMVRLADTGPVLFVTEPEAAAINYAERDRLDPGQVVAVYDFGGGTFDAAVVGKTITGFELLGRPEGMDRLGGIDFDQAVFSHVNEAVDGSIQEADTSDPSVRTALARLRADCRVAKESLSTDTDVTIPVVLPGLHTEVRLTRSEFEAMVRPRLEETVASLERAVRSTGREMAQIEKVLLVGGSSRIPLVAEMVRAATGRPTAVDAHPKHAIALGAARHAALVVSANEAAQAAAVSALTAVVATTSDGAPSAVPRGEAVPEIGAGVLPILAEPGSAAAARLKASPGHGEVAGGRRTRLLAIGGAVAVVTVIAVAAAALALGSGGSAKTAVGPSQSTSAGAPTQASASAVGASSSAPAVVGSPSAKVPAGGDPTDPFKRVISAIKAKQFDRIADYACAAKQKEVKSQFDFPTQVAASLKDIPDVNPDAIVDAMSFTFENVTYRVASRDGDRATVAVTGTMRISVDRQKMIAVLQAAGGDAAAGQIDTVMAQFEPMATEGFPLDSTDAVVREGGKWLICQ